jgi:hypothetical protein
MSWQVTSTISGGHRYSTADYNQYLGVATALSDASRTYASLSDIWNATVLQLQAQRYGTPLVDALGGGAILCSGSDHISFPYDRLIQRCSDHAGACHIMAKRLAQLADLVIRAHSLYSQADDRNRRILNELLQATVTAFPKESLAMAGILSFGGFILGSAKEGRTNGIHALDSLDWAQEGLMSGAGSAIAGLGGLRGLFHTDEVNIAAKRIAKITAPGYDLVQGNELSVTQVHANTAVVRESHGVADSMEDLRRLAEERLGKIDLGSGLDYGTIAISRYRREDGSNAWLVTIPGTDGEPDSPFGWPQNVELMSSDSKQRMQADSARMVAEAMRQAGIGSDEPVAMIGHSQGGIVAATLASDLKDEYDIEHVVTAGSPVANHPIPESTWVTSVEMDDELVAALDGAANPNTENWLTVRGTVSQTPDDDSIFTGTEVQDAPDAKEITHWLKYHQAAYRNATDMGSVALEAHERHFQNVIDGNLEEVTYWQGRMSK